MEGIGVAACDVSRQANVGTWCPDQLGPISLLKGDLSSPIIFRSGEKKTAEAYSLYPD